MAHARTQVRQAVVAALAATPYQVVSGRVYPLPRGDAETLSVATREEAHDPGEEDISGLSATAEGRRLALAIEARTRSTANLDDALDAMCLEVERAMGADPTLSGLVEWNSLRGTDYEVTGEQEKPLGLATLVYEVEYRVNRSDPEQIV